MTNLPNRIIIFGAGDFGHELAEFSCNKYQWSVHEENRIIFIDGYSKEKSFNSAWPIVSNFEDISHLSGDKFIIGVGDPIVRDKIFSTYNQFGLQWETIIHPTSYVSEFASIQDGVIVSPHCTIAQGAIISKNVLLNSYVAVGHHVEIMQNSVISPKVVLAGRSRVGKNSFIGSGAILAPGIKIGESCRISAGSVIFRQVKDGSFVSGNPGKALSDWKKND